MTELNQPFTKFIAQLTEENKLWALQNEAGDWVVCDSAEFEDADVMPVWADAETATSFCVDEWQTYSAAAIDLEDFLEDWISDLNEDGVLIGVDWQVDAEGIELDAIKFAKLVVDA